MQWVRNHRLVEIIFLSLVQQVVQRVCTGQLYYGRQAVGRAQKVMEEVESRRPATPNQGFDASSNHSPSWDRQASPSEKLPESSPHNSVGGNISAFSSRNSSLSRSQSKASLRSFFSRGRSASVASLRPDSSTSRGRPATTSKHSRHSSSAVARTESPHLSQIGSRLDSYRPTQVTHAAHIDRARSNRPETRRRSSPWDPPPLFQAYPQSLKHTTLDASCLSADVILRNSSYKKGRNLHEGAKSDPIDTQSVNLILKKAKGGSNKHARKFSASISSSGWTKHLYVLVDSGYLLQYPGSGRLDRLPDKMMQLGKDTVAFASDAIPGRHWVLQVSQTSGDNAIVLPEPYKGLLSRFGVLSSEYRRTVQNFLMVFDNAEDLDSWLTTIRKEVEALGGQQYQCETPTDLDVQYLRAEKLNQRYSAQEDSYQFLGSESGPTHQVLSPVESEFPENEGGHVEDRTLEFRFWDNEATSQQASEDSSTITSTELERLRDSKGSGGSTGTGATTSLHGRMSPAHDKFSPNAFPSFESVDLPSVLDAQISTPHFRESTIAEPHSPMFLCHALNEMDLAGDNQRVTQAIPSFARKSPNITTNFSIPISSNRFSFFGSTEALNPSTIGGSQGPSSPTPEDETFEDDSAENDSSSQRPVSIIAPLPTPEALMNPTGIRKWNARRPSVEKPQPSLPGLANYDYIPSSGHTPTPLPERLSSLDNKISMVSAPLPSLKKELPSLPRSKSYQGLSTFYNPGEVPSQTGVPTRPPQGQVQPRPLSLSVFPDPPSWAQPVASAPNDAEASKSSLLLQPLNLSRKTPLPTVTITKAPAGVNPRLSRIRDSRGVPRLGTMLPSGPPPTCPLPETPSPRKRRVKSFSKRGSCMERDRFNIVPLSPRRRSRTGP